MQVFFPVKGSCMAGPETYVDRHAHDAGTQRVFAGKIFVAEIRRVRPRFAREDWPQPRAIAFPDHVGGGG